MKKRTLITLLGLWIALIPFLGIPSSWKSRIIIVSGLAVAFFAVTKSRSGYSKNVVLDNIPTSSSDVHENMYVKNKESKVSNRVSSVTTFVPASSSVEKFENPEKESASVGIFSETKKTRKPRVVRVANTSGSSTNTGLSAPISVDAKNSIAPSEIKNIKVYKVSNQASEKSVD